MTNRNFMMVDNFKMMEPPKQLELLAEFVMEANSSSNDVDIFNNRLKIYASKAGIDEEQARKNVKTYIRNENASRLRSYGL